MTQKITMELNKGISFDLEKEVPELTKLRLGLKWEAQPTKNQPDFDLDSICLALYSNKKIKSANDVIFYNNKPLKTSDGMIISVDGAIKHLGDNLIGGNVDTDDETIIVELNKLDKNITYLLFAVTIFDANNRMQTFGQVNNSSITLYNDITGDKICNYNLKNEYQYDQGVIFGVLEKQASGGWKFNAVGDGFQGTLNNLLEKYS